MLELKDLVKRYSTGHQALKEVNLLIPKGQVLALIGPSGASISTLDPSINRLIEPTSGKVLLSGEDVTRMASRRCEDPTQDGHDFSGIRAGRTFDGYG